MDDLIEALQIFRKYTNTTYPTYFKDGIMYIADITTDLDDDDIKKLWSLGFEFHIEEYRWGSDRFATHLE